MIHVAAASDGADPSLEARVRLLFRRALISIPLTLAAVGGFNLVLFSTTGDLRPWYGLLAVVPIQALRMLDALRYLGRVPAMPCQWSPQTALRRFVVGTGLLLAAWSVCAYLVIPTLGTAQLFSSASVFGVLQLGNAVSMSIFRGLGFGFAVMSSAPVLLSLAVAGSPLHPLSLIAIQWVALIAMLVELAHHSELRLLRRAPAPDAGTAYEQPQWLVHARVRMLYQRAAMGVPLAASIGFSTVAQLMFRSERPSLWYWLLGMYAVQTLRAADILHYHRCDAATTAGPARRWKLRFGLGLVATAIVWLVFLWTEYPLLDLLSRMFVLGMLLLLSVGSLLSLASVRELSAGYTMALLLPVAALWLREIDSLNATSALLMVFLMSLLLVLIEMMYRVTSEALQVGQLKSGAERREIELSKARNHLIDANATLEHKVAERTAELERLASEDPLTGLYNRNRCTALTQAAIDAPDSDTAGFAICFVDLDGFKEINDGLGHPAGDLVLREVAQRLRRTCGATIACSRWGGDEFVLLHPGPVDEAGMQRFGEALLQSIGKPMEAYRASISLEASIGIALYPCHGRTAAELVEHADIAVYKAKQSGRSTVCLYEPQWGLEARRRLDLVQALRRAIDREALDLHFQPIVNLRNGRLYGLEALLRWDDPEHGSIPPTRFIPLAEDSGLILALGRIALRRACATLQTLYPAADGPIVAVNTSVAQITSKDFIAEVRAALADSGLPPQRLELEVTESLFAGNLDAVKATLQRLRQLGVRISIDDFGTGYSSMSYLSTLPLDTLKIDRAFVRGLGEGRDAIFSTLIRLAESLQLEVIVEGVETAAELQRVLDLGGRCVQGYHFARPMPASDLAGWSMRPADREAVSARRA